MRAIINISLPQQMARQVRAQAVCMGFSTVSEYMRDLIRKDLRNRLLKNLQEEAFRQEMGSAQLHIRQGYNPYRNGPSAVKQALTEMVQEVSEENTDLGKPVCGIKSKFVCDKKIT